MKLHLGCGKKIIPGWTNCDVQPYEGVEIVSSFEDLTLSDFSCDEVYMCHMLEHFGRHEVRSVLEKVYSFIKKDGILWVAVPDFEACVNQYSQDGNISQLIGLVSGGQKDAYDFHKMIFDFTSLKQLLLEVGFSTVERYNREEHDVEKNGIDDFSAAYIPHMDKSGRLMSLNLKAIK